MVDPRLLLVAALGAVLSCVGAIRPVVHHGAGSNDASLSSAIVHHLNDLIPESLCTPPQCVIVVVDTVVRLLEHRGPWMPARRPPAAVLNLAMVPGSVGGRFHVAYDPATLESFERDSAAAWLGVVSFTDTSSERIVVTMIALPHGSYEGLRTVASFRRQARGWTLGSVTVVP